MNFTSKRTWLSQRTWPFTSYVITNTTVTFGYFFFKFLNRTRVYGRHNVPQKPNTLLLSNHQSMIDSFLVGLFAFYPNSLLHPSLMPWNPAAEENFYKSRVWSWLADNWKCIPIKRGRKDVSAIRKMAQALRQGPMTLFPEGTRSRDGSIGQPRGGAGLLILETMPTVIPVYIDGMDQLLPIGAIFPRMFKRITICYGKPLDLSEFHGNGKNKEVAHAIMNRVMEQIRKMRSEIRAALPESEAIPDSDFLRSKKTA
ncbi:MAG: lysophospholipid acyltransferase family protein [bacterium]